MTLYTPWEEVMKLEVLIALSSMQKGEIPRPDNFIVDFCVGFYDLIKEYLLKVVKESQIYCKVRGYFNSNFISLIPKIQDGVSFRDYRPISCYNVVYKIIAKVIHRRLINDIISEEKFGFLRHIQIHDVASIAQEVLHYVKKF
jgi:hypothetical protein